MPQLNNFLTEIFLDESLKFLDLKKVDSKIRDQQILRMAISAEIDAVNMYEFLSTICIDKKLKKVLLDIAGEEKVHIGEFEALLESSDDEYVAAKKDGKKEIKKM